jgi:hypothetical protein
MNLLVKYEDSAFEVPIIYEIELLNMAKISYDNSYQGSPSYKRAQIALGTQYPLFGKYPLSFSLLARRTAFSENSLSYYLDSLIPQIAFEFFPSENITSKIYAGVVALHNFGSNSKNSFSNQTISTAEVYYQYEFGILAYYDIGMESVKIFAGLDAELIKVSVPQQSETELAIYDHNLKMFALKVGLMKTL